MERKRTRTGNFGKLNHRKEKDMEGKAWVECKRTCKETSEPEMKGKGQEMQGSKRKGKEKETNGSKRKGHEMIERERR